MFGSDSTIFSFRGPMGVPIEIGSSILFLAFIFLFPYKGPEQLMHSLIFFGLIILAIFLHEMGHAWATLIQRHDVKRIMIYGGGGFCERFRAVPRYDEEFIVAMGPLVNLALWAMCSLAVPFVYDAGFYQIGGYLGIFAYINLFFFFMNLIPVQPLDGGKLLFLMIRRFYDRAAAIKIAGFIGLVFSVLWIPAMIYCFVTFGFVLLFLPSIPLHWRMFNGQAA